MDEENSQADHSLDPPKPLSTHPHFHPHHPRTGSMSMSMSLGAPMNMNGNGHGEETSNGASTAVNNAHPQINSSNKAVYDVLNSEIGISTLLNRLKQSIASAKEFASFLKRRSTLEEEHSAGLRKLCRTTAEAIKKPDQRHGSFLHSFDEVATIHEQMADNGAQFAMFLHQMYEELMELTSNVERGRKHWKTNGLAAEARAADTDAAMTKSKAKYDALVEDYDRARTGDKQSGKIFGLKGPKSAAQHEEDLLRKVQAADTDYAAKVQAAQAQHGELLSKSRPEAVTALEDLVRECDSALTLQMQKFASYNEKILLSNGLNISPIKRNEQGIKPRSLREAIYAIDNEKDLNEYLGSHASKVPSRASDIKYERAALILGEQVLNSAQQSMPATQRQSDPPPPPPRQGPNVSHETSSSAHQIPPNQAITPITAPAVSKHERSFSQKPSLQQYGSGSQGQSPRGPPGHVTNHFAGQANQGGPPQLSTLPFQTSQTPPPVLPYQASDSPYPPASTPANFNNLPPLKPIFGFSLEQLFHRDKSPVPMIVYQCIQAVDLFGLELEGIYRLSGTTSHINKLKAMFDNGESEIDFRNPENFFHDVNSVAGLLKQFFRDLPDPLLTAQHYDGFIEAARHDDDTVRRDSLHAIINSLPDPNYATLRALTLHLKRVQEHSAATRMSASNLAIVFGPTLMGPVRQHTDAGWQVRVIDTILTNTYQIFDDDF